VSAKPFIQIAGYG